MSHTPLSAQQLYDAGPLGALVRFSDGAAEPPQRHRRKHAAWRSSNGTGRLVRKAPQKQALPASFTLHVGDFGSDDVTVVKAYRVFAVTSPLSFAIVDKPRPGQVALLQDDLGMPTLVHLADTEADAQPGSQPTPATMSASCLPRRSSPARSPTCRTPATAGSSSAAATSPGPACRLRISPPAATCAATPSRSRRTATCRGSSSASTSGAFPIGCASSTPRREAHVRRWAANPGPTAASG